MAQQLEEKRRANEPLNRAALEKMLKVFSAENLRLHLLLIFSLPCLALPCLALPCLALPCLALPCLALPCLALPCLLLCFHKANIFARSDPTLRDKVLKNPELSLIGLDPKAILAKHQNDFGQV